MFFCGDNRGVLPFFHYICKVETKNPKNEQ